MFNNHNDITGFHNDNVTLPQNERTEMRDRRNANRNRLLLWLDEKKEATPIFIKQGSYAMLTMVQDQKNDYDIDDGVYFNEKDLIDDDENSQTPKAIRKLVCDALADKRFNKQPKVKDTCVRIFYNAGYHVDMPCYRIIESDGEYELANGDIWVVSRAADVEGWFDTSNQGKSPDKENGRQFRRVTRLLKKFARSREEWKKKIATGFTITVLADNDCYTPIDNRDDQALHDTMKNIYDRLCINLEVDHPVTNGAKLTSNSQDSRTKFLREKLQWALKELKIVDDSQCSQTQARAAWDKVFNTDYFSKRSNGKTVENILSTKQDPQAVNKEGGMGYA